MKKILITMMSLFSSHAKTFAQPMDARKSIFMQIFATKFDESISVVILCHYSDTVELLFPPQFSFL